mmetsp:Transcript_114786/g.244995  ORF Transcript_114786/g.244995 Transcript_114786/m.244995 type:complete len:574 (+) Transcript_114786:50-1771(+)
MRVPLDTLFPAAHRWLQVLHLEHVLEFKSATKVMLMLSCLISLGFSVSWLLDIAQLTCFATSPWTREGVGSWTCLHQLVGGIILLFMFRHSAMALAYYDEDGDALRQRKERSLSELEKQCGDVLVRATSQAKQLCGMLSADLDEKVNEHVGRLQTILGKIEHDADPEAQRIYERLVIQMAHHLHNLRKPAIEHFEKLIALSGQAQFLQDALDRERHQSMVELLSGKHGLPRTETVHSDPELGVLSGRFGRSDDGLHLWVFGCCHPHHGRAAREPQKNNSVDLKFCLPTEADLQNELRELSPEERRKSPEKVVLRPMRLVLRWFGKIEPEKDGGFCGGSAKRPLVWETDQREWYDQLEAVFTHLRNSPFYRCMLFGIVASVGFFAFYWHMTGTLISLLRNGDCHGLTSISCISALFRQVFGLCAMACYAASLVVVVWNVERLDAVLQVQEEIHDLEDFKRQVDHLNANVLSDEDSSVSMMQTIEQHLAEQKRLVVAFINDSWGGTVQLSKYDHLAAELEGALATSRSGGGQRPGGFWRSVSAASASARKYTPLPGAGGSAAALVAAGRGRQGGA